MQLCDFVVLFNVSYILVSYKYPLSKGKCSFEILVSRFIVFAF